MEDKLTIEFAYTNEFGDRYEAKSTFMPIERSTLECLGDAFKTFLQQAGFMPHDACIIVNDLIPEELDDIKGFCKAFAYEEEP